MHDNSSKFKIYHVSNRDSMCTVDVYKIYSKKTNKELNHFYVMYQYSNNVPPQVNA